MSKNELIIRVPMLPARNTDNVGPDATVFVDYDQTSDGGYSFTSNVDDDISIHIGKDHKKKFMHGDVDDVVDVEYDEHVAENELLYYGIATASGLLTGLLSNHISENVVEKVQKSAHEEKKDLKELRGFVVETARYFGLKDKDYKKVAQFLMSKMAPSITRHMPVDLKNGEFRELSGQPTVAGLAFSILTQFSGKFYYLTKAGEIKSRSVYKGYVLGRDNQEKIALAVMYWFFYVCAGYVKMGKREFAQFKLPEKVLKVVAPICEKIIENKKIPLKYGTAEKQFDQWLAKIQVQSRMDNAGINVLDMMKDKMGMLSNQLFPVLINEGLVRASYTLCKLAYEIKNTAICSLDDIWAIDLKKLISYGNRIMSNMCLISSSTFVAANIGPAVVRAAISLIKDKKVSAKENEDIITKVNIAGVGRVFIAFADNSKYFNENIHILFNNLKWNKFKAWGAGNSAESGAYQYEKGMEDILSLMTLDNTQTRFLYSIENHMLQYDIAHTKKPSVQTAKKLWYSEWKSQVSALVNEEAESYFIHDEQLLYDELYRFARDYRGRRVICVLTMELCLFQPYIPLNSENDKEYKGLKIEADYIKEHYVRRQTVVTQKDTENIRKIFKHYIGIISGSTKNVMLGAGSAGIVAVAAGAAAFTFAPGIAVAIMGNSFVGLHGVALTNASLAALGGGSIAAGGFGMAGGAAVIAGGGALAGFTGSGAIVFEASMLMTSKEYRDALYAKLLTFVKYILKEKLGDTESVIKIKHIVSYICEMAEEQLKEMKAEKTPLDKEAIELTENYVKYLRKLNAEMKKI